MNKTGKKFGGRKKGTPNKSTKEIREILSDNVNYETLAKKFYQLALKGNINAGRILFELRFPYPKYIPQIDSEVDVIVINGRSVPVENNFDIKVGDKLIED